LSLAATASLAQDQRPLPRGSPEAIISSSLRVHVIVSEEVGPDRLRALARPQVTLWLDARSNTLKESTLEQLGRFDEAWVRLRAPLAKADARVLAKTPKVGLWLDARDLDGVAGRVPGVRRLAIDVEGPLDDALAERLRRARPAWIRWKPTEAVDLLSWARFRQVPGHQVWSPPPSALLPTRCAERTAAAPSLELHLATLLAMNAELFPCGRGTRVVVNGNLEPWLLQSLVVRDPSLELVVAIGGDPERAAAAVHLLDRLAFGPGR
jgi:hypothetical protein